MPDNLKRTFCHWLLWLAVGLVVMPAAWCQTLEVLALKHRRAEELIPQLKPFVEAGGTLGGMNDTLFLKASARNQAEIKKLLLAMDTPLRRLVISVRQVSNNDSENRGAGAGGGVILGDGKPTLNGNVKIYSSDRHSKGNTLQQVQTVDGGRAAIHVGQSFLVPLRQITLTPAGAVVSEGFVQRDLGTGFVALPKLSGDRVTLEISPTDDALVSGVDGSGPVATRRLTTTIAGRLGEWIDLGSSGSDVEGQQQGVVHYGTRSRVATSKVQLKAEELP